jgi:hypothetical protein
MGKDWRHGDKNRDKVRKFNKDEHRKQKHEKAALRAVDVDKLLEVEDEAGNTFYTTNANVFNDEQEKLTIEESTRMIDEREFLREINAYDPDDFEEYQKKLREKK